MKLEDFMTKDNMYIKLVIKCIYCNDFLTKRDQAVPMAYIARGLFVFD